MSYIYKITNKVNGKTYVGNTAFSIKKRWREHCADAKKSKCADRPLYRAMNKYGIDSFEVSIIEQCEPDIAQDREKYWIEALKTFKYGYNDTKGGNGKQYIDYDIVVATYNNVKSKSETARVLGISIDSVVDILKKEGVASVSKQTSALCCSKAVSVYDMSGRYIKTFPSLASAGKWAIEQTNCTKHASRHIQRACIGIAKSAYGYVWKYADTV